MILYSYNAICGQYRGIRYRFFFFSFVFFKKSALDVIVTRVAWKRQILSSSKKVSDRERKSSVSQRDEWERRDGAPAERQPSFSKNRLPFVSSQISDLEGPVAVHQQDPSVDRTLNEPEKKEKEKNLSASACESRRDETHHMRQTVFCLLLNSVTGQPWSRTIFYYLLPNSPNGAPVHHHHQ